MMPPPSSIEMLPQCHPCVMQLRFRRPGHDAEHVRDLLVLVALHIVQHEHLARAVGEPADRLLEIERQLDRKSTRLNSSHGYISYAVFCLKKKKMPASPKVCKIENHARKCKIIVKRKPS